MDHDDSVTQQPFIHVSDTSHESEALPKPQGPSQESVAETEEQENVIQQSLISDTGDETEATPKPQASSPESDAESTVEEQDNAAQQSLMSNTGDDTEATPKPQDSSSENDADSAAEQNNTHYTTIAPVADEKTDAHLWLVRLASTWWVESITMCLSFACMGALICILVYFQDRLSTDWSFFISLNATVAIAITAAKATLLATISVCLSQEKWNRFRNKSRHLQDLAIIDTASRGPLGSFQMLFQVSWGFATISAVVVILSILTDTLVQQVMYLEPGTVYIRQEASATFGYAYGYNGLADKDYPAYTLEGLRKAFLRGIYQDSWPTRFHCNSNCTWDQSYLTLGFSSTCANVTEETIGTLEGCDQKAMSTPCRITTPRGGVQFNFDQSDTQYMLINSSEILKYRPFTAPVMDKKSKFIKDSDLFTAAIWSWGRRDYDFESLAGFKETLLQESVIIECTLGVALYNYSNISSTPNAFNIGTTEEIPIGNYSGITGGDFGPPATHWWNDTSRRLPDIYLSANDLYLLNYFSSEASFSTTRHLWAENSSEFSPGATAAFGNGSLEIVSTIFDRVALSITDMIREGDSMQIAQGKTSQAVIFIRVRWRWLILPLAVHFLGAIALVGTIIKRSRDVPLWKGSALAVLYHSVDKDGVLAAQVKDLEELERIKAIQVMLEKKSNYSDS